MLDLDQIHQLTIRSELSESEVLKRLRERILDLMQTDREKLYFHLYRVDIDDHYLDYLKTRYKTEEKLAEELARVVLERTLKKIKTQKDFKD